MEETDTIRIFIGSSPSEWLPAKVLEYSIRRRTAAPIDVTLLYESSIEIPIPKDKNNRPRTPFSFQRFLIPQLCNYEGKAIYLDADMLVFDDIYELWSTEMFGNDILSVPSPDEKSKPQFSVMLMNTSNLLWRINLIIESLNKNLFTYDQLMYDFAITKSTSQSLNPLWNSLELLTEETKLLHYTNMYLQPWVSLHNPYRDTWVNELFSAIQDNHISMIELSREISNGVVRPSLIAEINALLDGKKIPLRSELEGIDANFQAPFRSLTPNIIHRIFNRIKRSSSSLLK